jgi:hypothetical protein
VYWAWYVCDTCSYLLPGTRCLACPAPCLQGAWPRDSAHTERQAGKMTLCMRVHGQASSMRAQTSCSLSPTTSMHGIHVHSQEGFAPSSKCMRAVPIGQHPSSQQVLDVPCRYADDSTSQWGHPWTSARTENTCGVPCSANARLRGPLPPPISRNPWTHPAL